MDFYGRLSFAGGYFFFLPNEKKYSLVMEGEYLPIFIDKYKYKQSEIVAGCQCAFFVRILIIRKEGLWKSHQTTSLEASWARIHSPFCVTTSKSPMSISTTTKTGQMKIRENHQKRRRGEKVR